MRRVVVLLFLALALSVAASASTIDYTNQYGSVSITTSGISSTGSQLIMSGSGVGNVSFATGVCLSGCNASGIPTATSATFSSLGSSFDIVCHKATCGGNGKVLFSGAFEGPISLTLTSGSAKNLTYTLTGMIFGQSNGHYITGTTTQYLYSVAGQWNAGVGHIRMGDTKLVVPEPGTLGLLGTGLVGIAGMFRRRILGS